MTILYFVSLIGGLEQGFGRQFIDSIYWRLIPPAAEARNMLLFHINTPG